MTGQNLCPMITLKCLGWSWECCLEIPSQPFRRMWWSSRPGCAGEDGADGQSDRGNARLGVPSAELPLTPASDKQGIFPLLPRRAREGWAQEPRESTGVFPVWALDLRLDK